MCIETEARTIGEVLEGRMTVKDAATQLKVSSRTIWRKIARYKDGGTAGLIHGLTGKKSNRAKPTQLREEVLDLYKQSFGNVAISKFAADIGESKGISISRETVRKWLIDAGMWEGKKRTTVEQVAQAEQDITVEGCVALKLIQ